MPPRRTLRADAAGSTFTADSAGFVDLAVQAVAPLQR
jgi:hypothetical protein